MLAGAGPKGGLVLLAFVGPPGDVRGLTCGMYLLVLQPQWGYHFRAYILISNLTNIICLNSYIRRCDYTVSNIK